MTAIIFPPPDHRKHGGQRPAEGRRSHRPPFHNMQRHATTIIVSRHRLPPATKRPSRNWFGIGELSSMGRMLNALGIFRGKERLFHFFHDVDHRWIAIAASKSLHADGRKGSEHFEIYVRCHRLQSWKRNNHSSYMRRIRSKKKKKKSSGSSIFRKILDLFLWYALLDREIANRAENSWVGLVLNIFLKLNKFFGLRDF